MTVNEEILVITAEECAEVTQIVTKSLRFGLDSNFTGPTNRQLLANELGDLLCMVDLLVSRGIISADQLEISKAAKLERLKIWSNIFAGKGDEIN